MKALVFISLVLVSIVAPSSARAQSDTARRWTRFLTTDGETVDLDTTAIRRRDGGFVVWLRWDFDRHGPELRAEYSVEQVEVDCHAQRERVLKAILSDRGLRLMLDDTLRANTTQLDSVDTKWRTYSKGSLGAQSLGELCRRLTSGWS